jgi:hypothetical protein
VKGTVPEEEDLIVGFARPRIFLVALGAAVLIAASLAYAATDPSLSLSRNQAASGEEVGFKISNTEAWSTYTLKVENEVVARGSDPAGNGIDDKFKMPDLGSAEKAITVEATVEQPSSPGTAFVGTATMQYVLFPTAPTGPTSDPQPQPVPLAATPVSQVSPTPAQSATGPSTPATNQGKRTKHRSKHTTKNREPTSTGGSGGESTPISTPTTPSAPIPSSGGSSSPSSTFHTPKTPSAPTPQKPSGPAGAAGVAPPPTGPSGGGPTSGGTLTTPITGTARITSGGISTLLLVGLVLLALAAAAVGASRLRFVDWHRFALAGADDSDEVRLGALSRAARSGAEAQQAIALRKASRRAS